MNLLNEVNKISQNQETILSERQQKAKIKEQKEFLEYLTTKCKNDILSNIIKCSKDELIQLYVDEYVVKLSKYDYFDDVLVNKKGFEMIDFINKQLKKISAEEKSKLNEQKSLIKEQQKLDFDRFQLELVKFFESCYQEVGARAYFKLNACKQECLAILGQSNSYKAYNFYDTQNQKFFNKYKQQLKTNKKTMSFWQAALIGSGIGLVAGFKQATRKKGRF